ncbi:unnamed protein product [Bursaphelenchus xylophilus]|uniref:(pine wood nematode) hypothetical protein n=1 Tax=Bursaphelenchus xylophilus TaxID=6326 RepID=A0A811LU60_BURXY|nr:unnamed protein product [Bursaphelenchus xylophilus]CAG9123749.1 unnamed protein product [Bursaphelenchus xylophilus]
MCFLSGKRYHRRVNVYRIPSFGVLQALRPAGPAALDLIGFFGKAALKSGASIKGRQARPFCSSFLFSPVPSKRHGGQDSWGKALMETAVRFLSRTDTQQVRAIILGRMGEAAIAFLCPTGQEPASSPFTGATFLIRPNANMSLATGGLEELKGAYLRLHVFARLESARESRDSNRTKKNVQIKEELIRKD